jgi:hemolysin activation/secretion protein
MRWPVKTFLFVIACAGSVGTAFVSFAQQPVAAIPAPRFEINRFEIVGNTLLPSQELDRLVAPYTGKDKDFADVQRALEAVEQAYRARGYGVVQVLLPEQDITRGVVQFRVVEPRVGKVTVEGNKFFDNDNIRYSLPSVREGATPSSRDIARNLQPLNEHPAKQTTVSLRSGASEDQIDVNVKVTDEKPWRVFLSLDNTGTGETGYFRSGIGFQHSNLFNRDHVLTAQYITSPTQPSDVTIAGVGYHIPFYRWNSTLDLIAGYSDVDSGTVQGLFNVSGSGVIGAARWNYYLPKWKELEHKVSLGLDYRAFNNDVLLAGTGLVPDITIHPVSLTYSALRRFAAAEISGYISVSKNIPFGSDGEKEDFSCPRPSDGLCARAGANPNYTILRLGATYQQALPRDFQARIAFNAQDTRDALVPGEQFGIGGPDSVRGYLVREIASDRGYQAQFELYTPDIARMVRLDDPNRLRFLAFFDYGSVDRNKVLPGEIEGAHLKSAGIGLRYNYGKLVSARLDLAQILHSSPSRSSDSQRIVGALAVVF